MYRNWLIWLVVVTVAFDTNAAPGDLEPEFANSGVFRVDVTDGASSRPQFADRVFVHEDMSVTVLGRCSYVDAEAQSFERICAVKLDRKGNVTASGFGTNGRYIHSGFDTVTELVRPVISFLKADIDDFGRIVFASHCGIPTTQPVALRVYKDVCVFRLSRDGTIDRTFGDQGLVKFRWPAIVDSHALNRLLVLRDARITIASNCQGQTVVGSVQPTRYFCLARLNANGTFDLTFASQGMATFDAYGGWAADRLSEIVEVPGSQNLWLAGSCVTSSVSIHTDGCIVKLDASGTAIEITTYPRPNGSQVFRSVYGIRFKKSVSPALADVIVRSSVVAPQSSELRLATSTATYSDFTVELPGEAITHDGRSFRSCSFDTLCVTRINRDYSQDSTFVAAPVSDLSVASDFAIHTDDGVIAVGPCNPAIGSNAFCGAKFVIEPETTQCRLDLDGDGSVLLTSDTLILTRALLRLPATAIMEGIKPPPWSTRFTWPQIKQYLKNECGMRNLP